MSGEVPVRGVHDNGVEPVSFCYRINSGLGPTVSGFRDPVRSKAKMVAGSGVVGI